MNATDTILATLDALITKGNEPPSSIRHESDMSCRLYNSWQVQALTCIDVVAGSDSEYHQKFALQTRTEGPVAAAIGVGVLSALREDVANGYLRRTADLVSAHVFNDFLEMADHLLSAGYDAPAASLVRAVLEDGLRRLGVAKGRKVAAGDDISTRIVSGRLYLPRPATRTCPRARTRVLTCPIDAVSGTEVGDALWYSAELGSLSLRAPLGREHRQPERQALRSSARHSGASAWSRSGPDTG